MLHLASRSLSATLFRRAWTAGPSRTFCPPTRFALHSTGRLPPRRDMSVCVGGEEAAAAGTYSNTRGTNWTVDLFPSSFPEAAVAEGEIGTIETDLLAIGVFEDAFATTKNDDETEVVKCTAKSLMDRDDELNGALSDIVAQGDFKGEAGKRSVVRSGGKVKNVGLFGLGKRAEAKIPGKWGRSVYYKFGAQVAHAAKGLKSESVAVMFDSAPDTELKEVASHMSTGLLLDAYESTRYKEKAKPSPLKSVTFYNMKGIEEGLKKGYAVAKGTNFTMYMVESPPNVCYPQYLADAAGLIAKKFPEAFELKVLEKDECAQKNMGLYLGVANASSSPPKFIHLKYSKGTPKEVLAIVGKGITFDSGGYNLKVGASRIEDMKMDMGGAGAALGAAHILGSLAPDNIEVHFIVAACENMINGEGYRPGDIIRASNGKSVEVMNTDAEGRLTLADALLYAQNECKATSIVDMATLTGAIIIALGNSIAGLFTPSDAMAAAIVEASQRTGDRVWRLPLEPEYTEELTKGIADLKNVGGRAGSSIIAGLFLKEFVKTDDVEWAHIDIAGTGWSMEKRAPTGFGAALFAEWVLGKANA